MKTLIAGNGITAVTAAQALSKEADIEVTILSQEPHLYYSRPRLWSYIAGEIAREELVVRKQDWYTENRIEVLLGETAVAIDPGEHHVSTASGRRFSYDRLLLATGARPFVPPIPGSDLEGVFSLRTLEDADAISARAEKSRSAVVIGGGLLGLEIARVLLGRGLQVTVLETAPYLLPRQLDRDGAGLLTGLLEEMGLQIRADITVEKIDGSESVSAVCLADGERIDADLVLMSTGIRSNIDLARQAGLDVNRGILVDAGLQTSRKDIFAAGDAAEFDGVVYGIIPAALEQARSAAAAMTSGSSDYSGTIPSTNLKVTGIDLTSIGDYLGECEGCAEYKEIDPASQSYRKIAVKDGVIQGAILVNDQPRSSGLSRLIKSGQDVSGFEKKIVEGGFDIKALTHRQI